MIKDPIKDSHAEVAIKKMIKVWINEKNADFSMDEEVGQINNYLQKSGFSKDEISKLWTDSHDKWVWMQDPSMSVLVDDAISKQEK